MRGGTSTPTPEAGAPSGAPIDALPQPAWNAGADGGWTAANHAWIALTGLSMTASLGRGWLHAVHPDDRAVAESALAEATRSGGLFAADLRLTDADGASRLYRARAAAERDRQGGIARWIGTFTDIDDLKSARDETGRRTRGVLAMARSIARRTAATSDSIEASAAHLDGRFDALARLSNMVSRDPAGVDLEAMIREELLAHAAPIDTRVEIGGPRVLLAREVVEVLGLAIHELVTNAVKFGALSSDRGGIVIGWRAKPLDGHARLAIVWTESGIPADASHATRGFGTEVVERMLRYELDAQASLTIGGGRLLCLIDIPAAAGVVIGG